MQPIDRTPKGNDESLRRLEELAAEVTREAEKITRGGEALDPDAVMASLDSFTDDIVSVLDDVAPPEPPSPHTLQDALAMVVDGIYEGATGGAILITRFGEAVPPILTTEEVLVTAIYRAFDLAVHYAGKGGEITATTGVDRFGGAQLSLSASRADAESPISAEPCTDSWARAMDERAMALEDFAVPQGWNAEIQVNAGRVLELVLETGVGAQSL